MNIDKEATVLSIIPDFDFPSSKLNFTFLSSIQFYVPIQCQPYIAYKKIEGLKLYKGYLNRFQLQIIKPIVSVFMQRIFLSRKNQQKQLFKHLKNNHKFPTAGVWVAHFSTV